ncbi:MAG: CHAT domain-containing protein, partial [bacterium]|nr:CHAT domain-containing protein [bacterium]
LARFEAQLADILVRQGDLAGAVRDYEMALRATAPLGTSVGPEWKGLDPFDSGTDVPAVALRQIDALLRLARQAANDDERSDLLFEARDRVEARRVQELKDHFRDPCISAQERMPADLIPNAIVVHPVPLPDRLALIVSSRAGIRAYEIAVGQHELFETLQNTGRQLRDRTTNRYQIGAGKLYDWLVRPIEADIDLHEMETLVFVSGPHLRSFPMAALYDRTKHSFLIEKIAVAATQGLSLTEPRPLNRSDLVVLRAGLAGEGEGALPHVRRELDKLADLFPGVELAESNFHRQAVEDVLESQSFDIIHIASHGRFPRDGTAPYVLTSRERLGLNTLASMIRRTRFRDRPTELITLSACETAVGDERAALGFAGLAIRAGARSTLATLWRVNDEVTSDLMQYFYTHLASGSTSRAGALREAQRTLLDNAVLRHPYWWAPYMLLGNWQ